MSMPALHIPVWTAHRDQAKGVFIHLEINDKSYADEKLWSGVPGTPEAAGLAEFALARAIATFLDRGGTVSRLLDMLQQANDAIQRLPDIERAEGLTLLELHDRDRAERLYRDDEEEGLFYWVVEHDRTIQLTRAQLDEFVPDDVLSLEPPCEYDQIRDEEVL